MRFLLLSDFSSGTGTLRAGATLEGEADSIIADNIREKLRAGAALIPIDDVDIVADAVLAKYNANPTGGPALSDLLHIGTADGGKFFHAEGASVGFIPRAIDGNGNWKWEALGTGDGSIYANDDTIPATTDRVVGIPNDSSIQFAGDVTIDAALLTVSRLPQGGGTVGQFARLTDVDGTWAWESADPIPSTIYAGDGAIPAGTSRQVDIPPTSVIFFDGQLEIGTARLINGGSAPGQVPTASNTLGDWDWSDPDSTIYTGNGSIPASTIRRVDIPATSVVFFDGQLEIKTARLTNGGSADGRVPKAFNTLGDWTWQVDDSIYSQDGQIPFNRQRRVFIPDDSSLTFEGGSFVFRNIDAQFYEDPRIERSQTGADGPGLIFRAANGTPDTPTGVVQNDVLGEIDFQGHNNAGAFARGAAVIGVASEDWASTSFGSRLEFETVQNGTSIRTVGMILHDNKNLELTNGHLHLTDSFARIGVGTTSPSAAIEVAGDTSDEVQITASMTSNTANVSGSMRFFKERSGPADLLVNTRLGQVIFSGRAGGIGDSAIMRGVTSQAWSPGNRGSRIEFLTTKINTAVTFVGMTLADDGRVGIGNTLVGGALSPKLEVVGTNSGDAGEQTIQASAYNDATVGGRLRLHHDRGTEGTPIAIKTTDELGAIQFTGREVGGDLVGGEISVLATEDWDQGTDRGTKMEFAVIPNGGGAAVTQMLLLGTGEFSLLNIGTTTNSGADPIRMIGTELLRDTSRRVLKMNIVDVDESNAVAAIEALQPRTFDWKESGSADLGFIAEEVADVHPNFATYGRPNDDAPSSINDRGIIAALTAVVKNLLKRIKTLETAS